MTNHTIKSAIILLYSLNLNLEQLRQSLVNYCYDNNLSIIKIIEIETEYDYKAFIELCHSVRRKNNNQSITLIIDKDSFESFSCFLGWVVLGVLLKTKSIDRLFVLEKNVSHTVPSYKGYRFLSKCKMQKSKSRANGSFTLGTELSLLKSCFLQMKKATSIIK